MVTAFEFDLEPVGPTVAAGLLVHHADRAAEALEFFRDFAAGAPEEFTAIMFLRNAPPAPFLPPEIHGRPVLNIGVCYAGPVDEGMEMMGPLKQWGPPAVDLIEPKPYVAHQRTFDASVPHGLRYYWKSHYVADLSPPVADILVSQSWPPPTPMSYTVVFEMGGAIGRLGDEDTAFGGGRSAGYAVNINSVAGEGEDFDASVSWCRDYFAALEPYASGVYMNFLDQEGHDRVVAAYGQQTFDRLRALKDRYDPANFFRMNQNVPPSGNGKGS